MSSGSGRCLESSGRECKNIVESAAKERLKMGAQNYGEQKHAQTAAGDDLQVGQAATSSDLPRIGIGIAYRRLAYEAPLPYGRGSVSSIFVKWNAFALTRMPETEPRP
jgi:hypothetical protein